jgi:hypothetical protein
MCVGGGGGGRLASQRWLTVTGSKYRTYAALTPLYIPHIINGLYESRTVLQASSLNGLVHSFYAVYFTDITGIGSQNQPHLAGWFPSPILYI